MSIIDNIKNFFRRGGERLGMATQLTNITDHPRIGIDQAEYDRIQRDLSYYKGETHEIHQKNTYGDWFKREALQLNMAKVASRRLASLIFNERMKFAIDKNEVADTIAHEILEGNDFNKNFERYLESCLALGGIAMRPYFADGKVKIAYIQAPSFYPLQSNTNDISECAIATVSTQSHGNKLVYYTLLEFHEWTETGYVITNELYRSENAEIVGSLVPLTSNELFADLLPVQPVEGLKRSLFAYIKPFGFNNKDITSPLGLSIFDNSLATLDHINSTYDEFYWEIKMGQRRVAVPNDLVQSKIVSVPNGDDTFATKIVEYFEPNQNVYIGIGNKSEDGGGVQDLTTAIRSADYISAMNQFLKTLEMELGLSSGTFVFDEAGGLKTATEVVSENSMTYQTRNSHLSNVERGIQELIIACLEVAQANGLYNGEIPTLQDITIDFDDGVFIDKTMELEYWAKAKSLGLVSAQYVMKRVFDFTEQEITEQLAQINGGQEPPLNSDDQSIFGGE